MIVLTIALVTLAAELALTFLLSALRRAGSAGARVSDALCRAPLLDLLFGVMSFAPPVIGFIVASWPGLGGAILGQAITVPVWIFLHELVHRRAARGPRLLKAQNATIGRLRNHTALWITVLSFPIFWFVRFGEILFYPPLRMLLRFPKYPQGDWVNVSRHKFEGLVGHDLIWCLYCDWMTGVYSLAGEMLRNVESFWCPIRFYEGKKCENCRIDFPDVDQWATPDGSVEPAVALFEKHYGDGRREWFGHPARLTVKGQPPDDADDS